ncbi:hypothetical protein RJ640_025548 [Escallonia rubra]|uniref:Leucine-rich repeat-containing N-terminal plant-type domain-containing protein n=1 Tax=Escallonia rubra TaxID=112253 RepID=A0AA88QMZ2_9ASTE|nr:hypothetical protein RJ640_025548 [Escallonia rubra]
MEHPLTKCTRMFFLLGMVMIELQSYGSLGCWEDERAGLMKLKHAFEDNMGSSVLSSWGGGEERDCCKWEGVVCDNATKRVSRLSLSEARYFSNHRFLDASLFLPFQELQNLSLVYNFLAELTNLTNLEMLHLDGNGLMEIPASISALTSLKGLYLSRNRLNGLLPVRELTNLTNLEMLHLGSNDLMEIPSSIWDLTSLKALSLRGNGLNGLLPLRGFCKLVNLQELDLSNNGFGGKLPSCLTNLTSLRLLELSHNRFEGAIPSNLFPVLKSLQYISLSHNLFEGSFSFGSLANNSKLEVFELVSDHNGLKVETENPPWTPLFQLKVFHLSNCTLNDESRVFPSFLLNQFELREIDLSHNRIPGKVPMWLVANNTRLEFLNLANNSLTGALTLDLNSTFLDMSWFDISRNHIQGELPSLISSAFPNLMFLELSSNLFQGSIPPSLGNLCVLDALGLSDNNFSGQLPEHLVTGCVSLSYLTLSKNRLQGQFLPSKSNLTKLIQVLFLDSNFFSGEIPRGIMNSSRLWLLDLSDNLFSGKIPDWIGDLPLVSLTLSNNALEGSIPSGFRKSKELSFLDLSRNNLSLLDLSCLNLSSLRFLHLQRNEFRGPLPSFPSLVSTSSLVTFDVRDNKLSGKIPGWINSFSNLRVLLLGGNNFEGPIPLQLCDLRNISIIDLSHNELSGPIPSCLHGIKLGDKNAFNDPFIDKNYGGCKSKRLHSFSYGNQINVAQFDVPIYESNVKEEVEFRTKSRSETYKGNILFFMSGIDLSCNKLTGPVPHEIGYLSDIHALNLSHNHLTGPIPESFSNLRQIESLDLSHNSLSGQIPPKLVELNYLSVFIVAYNNLSGRTPDRKAQFATFEEHSYEGNSLLCGVPLERRCITNEDTSPPPQPSYAVQDDTFKVVFLSTFWPTYAVAFVGIVVILYYCPYHEYLISM